MSTDESMVDQMFAKVNSDELKTRFSSDNWQFLLDTSGGGNAITQTLYFDTLGLKSQLVDWQSAVLAIPMTLYNGSGGGTQYTTSPTAGYGNTELAIKGSILSLINSITINTGSGQNLVNDTNLHLINNMRLLLDFSQNFNYCEGPELCYAKDTANSSAFSSNAGAKTRYQYMMNQCNFGTVAGINNIYFTAMIPIRFLHEFFDMAGMQLNTHYQMNFGLNFNNGSVSTAGQGQNPTNTINNFCPFTIGTTTNYPTIKIGNPQYPTCRIFYRCLKLKPDYATELANKFSSGFTKEIDFRVTDISPILASDTNLPVGPVQKTVSASTVKPSRLIVLGMQSGALNSALLPAPWILPAQLSNTQIYINNQSYFNNPLQTNLEHYLELKRSQPSWGLPAELQQGNQISYNDFNGDGTLAGTNTATIRPYVFDIDRLRDRIVSPNDACKIDFTSQKVDPFSLGANTDFYYLIERSQVIKFDFSTNEVQYVLGKK